MIEQSAQAELEELLLDELLSDDPGSATDCKLDDEIADVLLSPGMVPSLDRNTELQSGSSQS